MGFIETLESWDVSLFFFINRNHHAFPDAVMEFVSLRIVWVPAYLFLALLLYKLGGWQTLLTGLVGAGLLLLWCDTGSVHLFKNVFLRYRPCHNEAYGSMVHIVNQHCGGKYGFVSSHATNFFGLAMFFSLILHRRWKRSWIILFSCAALVAYSRVYLGVHYPSDVVIGGLYGSVGGMVCYYIFRKINKIYQEKYTL